VTGGHPGTQPPAAAGPGQAAAGLDQAAGPGREAAGPGQKAAGPDRAAGPGQEAAGLDQGALARLIVTELTERGGTVAVAESLTGGLLAAALVDVPGASLVFRGGIVAYATDLKHALLDVPASLLDRFGAVHPDVAMAMAEGARQRLEATFGIATTGVAGPEPADGQPAGTVFIAASTRRGGRGRSLSLTGDRLSIRQQTVQASLELLREMLEEGGERHGPTVSLGEEVSRLQRYVSSEHSGVRSRRLSVRAGTVEA
jgi:nicotinamide-nucleotide amidase